MSAYRRVNVVERVGVAAVGTQHQRAVGAGNVRAVGAGGAGRDVAARYASASHDAGDGGIGTQGVAARTRVMTLPETGFGAVSSVTALVSGSPPVGVEDVDGERAVGGIAAVVLDDDGDVVETSPPVMVLGGAARVAVADGTGRGVVAGDGGTPCAVVMAMLVVPLPSRAALLIRCRRSARLRSGRGPSGALSVKLPVVVRSSRTLSWPG